MPFDRSARNFAACDARRPGSDQPQLRAAALGRLLRVLAPLIAVAACSPQDRPPAPAPTDLGAVTAESPQVVVRLPGTAMTAADVDSVLMRRLADLDSERFRLRLAAAEALAFERLAQLPQKERSGEILLAPPTPPVFRVETDARVRPAAPAPVTVTVFCDFQSPHCARFELTLARVLPLYGDTVRVAARDLPQPFHRFARRAAEAAQCAAEQHGFWRFHDVLYAYSAAFADDSLRKAAVQSGLDPEALSQCVADGRHAPDVARDETLARNLGFDSVPAVLVGGAYASSPVTAADLIRLIDAALAGEDRSSPRLVPATTASSLAIEVNATLSSAVPGLGAAQVSLPHTAELLVFHAGDELAAGVILRRVLPGRIELLNDGRPEFIELAAPRDADDSAERDVDEAGPVITPHRAVPVVLDRTQVLTLLSDRIALDEALAPVTMTAGGNRLLKVASMPPGSLYELLGFEPGDVVVSVNEQPVFEGSNPLWEALERDGEVRVRVIRRGGAAKHFTYRFSE